MSNKRSKTNYTGVFSREHESRRHKGKPDTCYDICYRLPGDRKLIWEKAGWASEKITAAIASSLRAERIKQSRVGNLPTETAKLTLDEVFERFRVDYLEVSRKHPGDAVSIYKNRIQPAFGHLPLPLITTAIVDALKKDLAHLSAQSINHTITLLGQIFRQARTWGIYEGSIPTENVKVPQGDGRRMRFLTQAEAQTLLEALAARSPNLWHMALVSLYTGLRAGEVFALRWEHVNFTAGTITVMDGKGEQNRVVHMPDQVKNAMLALRAENKGRPGMLVFPKFGEGTDERTEIGSTFHIIVRDCKLNEGITDRRDRIVFHSLRLLAGAGRDSALHSAKTHGQTIAMTQRYAHLAPDQGQEAARVLSGICLQ